VSVDVTGSKRLPPNAKPFLYLVLVAGYALCNLDLIIRDINYQHY